jgi:hypothetical protein
LKKRIIEIDAAVDGVCPNHAGGIGESEHIRSVAAGGSPGGDSQRRDADAGERARANEYC